MSEKVILDTDEAVISFAYELYKQGVDIKLLIKEMDNRGISFEEVLYCKELPDENKVEFLKLFD